MTLVCGAVRYDRQRLGYQEVAHCPSRRKARGAFFLGCWEPVGDPGDGVATGFAAGFLHDSNPAEKVVSVDGDRLICDIVTPDGKDAESYAVQIPVVEGMPHEELTEPWRRLFARRNSPQ